MGFYSRTVKNILCLKIVKILHLKTPYPLKPSLREKLFSELQKFVVGVTAWEGNLLKFIFLKSAKFKKCP